MNFSKMITALANGRKVKRTDWDYGSSTYLFQEIWRKEEVVSIANKHNGLIDSKEAYYFSLQDVQVKTWEICN